LAMQGKRFRENEFTHVHGKAAPAFKRSCPVCVRLPAVRVAGLWLMILCVFAQAGKRFFA